MICRVEEKQRTLKYNTQMHKLPTEAALRFALLLHINRILLVEDPGKGFGISVYGFDDCPKRLQSGICGIGVNRNRVPFLFCRFPSAHIPPKRQLYLKAEDLASYPLA